MRLTTAQAAQLAHLAKGGSLQRSRVAKALLPLLENAGVVRTEKSGSSSLMRGVPGKIEAFAEHYWGIRDLSRFALATPGNRSRESLAEIAGDSKALPSNPLAGIFIRSFGNCTLGDQPLMHTPLGSAILISPAQLPYLRVTARTLIVIENSECLLKFEKVLPYFTDVDRANIALVLRWNWRTAWQEWLHEWTGKVVHFPDYDQAGLRIFATEVLPHAPEARLLIPSNLEAILNERGSRNLFLRQEHLSMLEAKHPDIAQVNVLIQTTRKALEQETLLH
ncbi:MAG: hypothetical protein ABIT76_02490 [Chthoniobacterales bacterium]